MGGPLKYILYPRLRLVASSHASHSRKCVHGVRDAQHHLNKTHTHTHDDERHSCAHIWIRWPPLGPPCRCRGLTAAIIGACKGHLIYGASLGQQLHLMYGASLGQQLPELIPPSLLQAFGIVLLDLLAQAPAGPLEMICDLFAHFLSPEEAHGWIGRSLFKVHGVLVRTARVRRGLGDLEALPLHVGGVTHLGKQHR